jgi:Gpi18-like mannosyltransferase
MNSGSPLATPTSVDRSSRWIALFWSTWLASAVICGALLSTPGYEADIRHYKDWARKLTLDGIETAYSGKNTRDYVMYTPVFVYVYAAVGWGYAHWIDPRFDAERMKASSQLTLAIKGVAVAAHLTLGAALFFLLSRLHSGQWAAIASAAYLLNPATIFASAVWGAPDGFHSLGVVAALGLTELGLWVPAWLAMALAVACKPQAWILAPIFAVRQLYLGGISRIVLGGFISGLTLAVLILPFLLNNRLGDVIALPSAIAQYMPYTSVNAHNLWWLVNDGRQVLDRDAWIGPISYELASLALVLAVTLFVLRWTHSAEPGRFFMLAAYQAFGWYCVTTQLHENHSFFVLPLLALALPFHRWAWAPLCGVTVTLLANMVLHDPIMTGSVPGEIIHQLATLNASANMAILAAWTWQMLGLRLQLARRLAAT